MENSVDISWFIPDMHPHTPVFGGTPDERQMGLSPFETLGAVYAGLKLFGIAGLFLGPLGLLLIEDMTELLVTQPVNRKPQKNGTSQL